MNYRNRMLDLIIANTTVEVTVNKGSTPLIEEDKHHLKVRR